MDLHIRRAKPAEAEVLTEIAHAAKRHWGYPENWIEHWKNDLTITPEFPATDVGTTAVPVAADVPVGVGVVSVFMLPCTKQVGCRPESTKNGLGVQPAPDVRHPAMSDS